MPDVIPQLRSVFWEATLTCNAHCPFCGSRCENTKFKEIDGDTVYRTFQTIARAYDPQTVMVNVTGGEPLMRKDLFTVMGKIHALGFPWGMVTNGSLITDSIIQQMKEAGMRTISVSIDGLHDKHEELRRLPGAFSRIVEAIRKLDRAQFLDTIQITTVVTSENIDSLEDMLAFFSNLPVDSWRIAMVDPIGRCLDQQELLLRPEDRERYFSFLEKHAFHQKPILSTSCSHYLGDKDTLYRPHAFHCETGKSIASILADGSIFVCPNVPREQHLIQGNILTDDFVEVWANQFQWFRDDTQRKTGDCTACPEWDQCKGDSIHTWDFQENKPAVCYKTYSSFPEKNPAPVDFLLKILKEKYFASKEIRFSYGSSSGKKVFFTPEAGEELYCYFHWGKTHPVNICEQMMAAVGHIIENQAWIEELIPVPILNRAEKSAAFHMDLHKYILDEIALMNQNLTVCDNQLFGKTEPYCLLGYIHSHPGPLHAVMSQPDLDLHNSLLQKHDACLFSGIINPQRKDLCLYWDSVYSPVDVGIFVEKTDIEKWL